MSISPSTQHRLDTIFHFEDRGNDTPKEFLLLELSYRCGSLSETKKTEAYERLRRIADRYPCCREDFEELTPPENSTDANFNFLYQKILDQVENTEAFRTNLEALELFAQQNPGYKERISIFRDPIEVLFLALKDRFKKIEGCTEESKIAYAALKSFVEAHSQFTQRLAEIQSPNHRYFSSKVDDYKNRLVSPSRALSPNRWYEIQKRDYDKLREWVTEHSEFEQEFLKLEMPIDESNIKVLVPMEEALFLKALLQYVNEG